MIISKTQPETPVSLKVGFNLLKLLDIELRALFLPVVMKKMWGIDTHLGQPQSFNSEMTVLSGSPQVLLWSLVLEGIS